jgi:hypothetical protein
MDRITKEQLQEALDEIALAGGPTAASRNTGIARTTLIDRANRANALGLVPLKLPPEIDARFLEQQVSYESEIAALKRKIKTLAEGRMSMRDIRGKIFQLSEHETTAPDWVIETKAPTNGPGVPTLFLSDWHWGEVVRPEMVDGANEYNLEIASKRFKMTIERAIDLCKNHMVKPKYPGIVVPLGGDMISGDIHEELKTTNDGATMSHVFDLFDHLVWGLDKLADTFGKVFVPCAYGNHGRNTEKPIYKEPAETNFDWLIYNMLERHFQRDKRFTFMVPIGFDSYYKIYGTHYVLTHGDRLGAKGGKGVVGVVAPIVRGANNIKANYAAKGKQVDYVIMGHWHQYMTPGGVIVNGAGKGFDEFAQGHRFEVELPTQALWFTHPKHGITCHWPIFLADHPETNTDPWVAVQ